MSKAFCKRLTVKLVLNVLSRAITVLHAKPLIAAAAEKFAEGEMIRIGVMQKGPDIFFIKKNHRLIRLKADRGTPATLNMQFKSIDSLFKLCTARLSVHTAFCQHRMSVAGDLGQTMAVVRAMYYTEASLFPWIIAKHVLKCKEDDLPNKLWTYLKLPFAKKAVF